jgi:uncharacterized Tic20 family protein
MLPDTTRPKDDQFMAALCYASFVIPVIGIVVPFVIWLTQRERSPYLRFQAMQAFAFQLLAVLAYILYYAFQIIVPILMLPMALIQPEHDILGTILVSLMLGALFTVAIMQFVFFCIGGPLYLFMGFFGAWRVLQGHDFQYPLLGNLVGKFANRKSGEREQKPTETNQ